MRAHDLLPPLTEEPRDARRRGVIKAADEVVYRLGLLSYPVPGLPDELTVGGVSFEFVEGPIRTQRTSLRQRHGLPIVFDKCMSRCEVGSGELVALLSVRERPVPDDLADAFDAWRARSLAAAGLVAAVLDERVVGPELLEDAILLSSDEYVGAADRELQIRSFLPLDVNAADRAALSRLAETRVGERSPAARAARLYRRAALEGPTADAYAMLWVAAECFSDKRTPSRKDIEAALVDSGLDASRLPIHVGLLIRLRADVQHWGVEDHERLRDAFSEMEAVVRVLIRQELAVDGGWWPAHDARAFREPFDARAAAAMGPGETVWHRDSLPALAKPAPLRIPRRVARAERDPRLALDRTLGDHLELVASVVVDAIEWNDPDATLAIRVGRPPGAPESIGMASNADTVWIPPDRLEGLADEERPQLLVNFVWDLFATVGTAVAQRAGITHADDGVVLIEAIGARAQYTRLVVYGEYDGGALTIPSPEDPIALGKLAGWTAAGDERAAAVLDRLGGRDGELCRTIAAGLSRLNAEPPLSLLR